MLGAMLVLIFALVSSLTPAAAALKVDVGTDPPMRWLSRAASMPDLCAPCNAGDQCDSGLCALDGATSGICTQVCDVKTPCPDNFVCTDTSTGSVCAPADATVCPSPYLAPLNTFCQVPATNNDPNLLIVRSCDVGLTCFVFGSGYGACVTACSALDQNQSCKFGQSCCFGADANGYCATPSPTQATGGCFEVQQVGDSCAQPDHSFCLPGSACLYAQTASAAKCYATCTGPGTCGTGGTCQTFQGTQVCCDAASFNPNDVSTCAPFAAICAREVGVVCQANVDCRLGLCLKNGSQAACSAACATDADCPGPSEDVNGDGVADGGSTCQTIGQAQRCWPVSGPAAAPACAVAKPTATADRGGGCSCAESQVAPTMALVAAMVALCRRLRCRP